MKIMPWEAGDQGVEFHLYPDLSTCSVQVPVNPEIKKHVANSQFVSFPKTKNSVFPVSLEILIHHKAYIY